jgi:hypothetical protein
VGRDGFNYLNKERFPCSVGSQPFRRKPDFRCSGEVLNRVHACGVNTTVKISQECMCDDSSQDRHPISLVRTVIGVCRCLSYTTRIRSPW